MNGKLGVILSLDDEPGEELYYVIRLFPGTQVVSLRQCNITAVPTPARECMWAPTDDAGYFSAKIAHMDQSEDE